MGEPDFDELRVSTQELFFDLVFVFTITQIDSVLLHEQNLVGLARMALLLGVLWWMYGGYAWLTNMLPPVNPARRWLLGLAMAGFLVVAIAVPTAFGTGALAFGLGYLLVTCVHAGLFLTSPETRHVLLRAAPVNVAGALALVAAAFLPMSARWALWVLVPVAQWLVPLLPGLVSVSLRPAHFVERHGLVLLIAFGESVVAIGTGIPGLRLTIGLVTAAVLALVVLAGLWWSYFGGADELAERRLVAADQTRRASLALTAFGRAFYVLLAGVIMIAAGVKNAIAQPWSAGHPLPSVGIGGGVMVYLLGDLLLRRTLRLGPLVPRLVAVVLAGVSIVVGTVGSLIPQLAMIALALFGTFLVERRSAAPGPRQVPPHPSI